MGGRVTMNLNIECQEPDCEIKCRKQRRIISLIDFPVLFTFIHIMFVDQEKRGSTSQAAPSGDRKHQAGLLPRIRVYDVRVCRGTRTSQGQNLRAADHVCCI